MESVVKRLLQIGSDDFVREILGVFLTEVPKRIEAIREGIASGDAKGVAFAAHSLRGSCGNMGAEEAESICGLIEERANAGHVEDLDAPAERLAYSLECFCDNLRSEHRALLER